MKTAIRFTLALAVGSCLAGGALAADDVMTPEHVARLRAVTSAEISPDGTAVAYTLAVPRIPNRDENGAAWSELHLVDREGNHRPFITGEVTIGSVSWTPDGRGISFLTKRGKDKNRSLYVIPVDGGEAQRVLEHETAISAYSWSPDGSRVAFLAADPPDPAIKQRKDQGFDAEVYEEVMLFTRVWIAAVGNEEAKPRLLDLPGQASALSWSPAGDRLVVALAPTPFVDDSYMFRMIHLIDVASGTVAAQVAHTGKIGQLAFSPDGRHLAMILAENANDPMEGRLMVAPVETGEPTDLLPGLLGHVTGIAWSDNDTITYLVDQGTTTSLEEIDSDGSNRTTIIPAGRTVLSGLSLSHDGSAGAVRSESPTHPLEVYAMSRGQRYRRLTTSNPWLQDLRLARQEVVRHPARDGLELEGLLIRPLDEEPGQRYPLIVCVHGGPEAHIRNGWLTYYSRPGQVAAARGFAVFYPNYRGSTGRGVEFSKASQSDYGGREWDDVLDGIDYLVRTGLVDRDRVGITGGSYGGFATAWCCTRHSEHFKAGVMFVGFSDMISKFGTTDIPQEMYLVHARKWPWEDWQFFLERSPVFHAERARTPLLIMGGADDPRVHPSQSLELYRYLKALGKAPVRLVRYPGEGHGNRNAAARYDYNLRMLRWFEHYLLGPGGDPPSHEVEYGFGAEK